MTLAVLRVRAIDRAHGVLQRLVRGQHLAGNTRIELRARDHDFDRRLLEAGQVVTFGLHFHRERLTTAASTWRSTRRGSRCERENAARAGNRAASRRWPRGLRFL